MTGCNTSWIATPSCACSGACWRVSAATVTAFSVDPLLGAVSGSPNGMESGHLSPEAHQPHATRTDLDTHDRSCPAQAMQEGEAEPTRTARAHLAPGPRADPAPGA